MALLKLKLTTLKIFGQIPSTQQIEQQDKSLREEYAEFINFGSSDEYKHYLELKNFVESGEPKRVKDELERVKYVGSNEHAIEEEFKRLKKDKALQNFLRINGSEILSTFKSIELSGKPTQFIALKELVNSSEYQRNRKEHKKNGSEEYQKEVEYTKLRKDSQVKQYFKLKASRPFQDYFKVDGTEQVTRYFELQNQISSNEFEVKKSYLLSKNKFEQTDAYKRLQEYNELAKSPKILWYQKLLKSNKFEEISRWELTFSDEFTGKQLDSSKWLTRYFWGEALAHKSYSLAGDNQAYTNGENIEIGDSSLKIVTKKKRTEGFSWDLRYGFVPKTFEYTSAIINTGQSFRQQYGRFEAKVKFTAAPGVYHSFWLVGDKMLPHVDIIRQNGQAKPSLQGSMFWQEGAKTRKHKSALSGFNLNDNFFILSIDWTKERMVWRINGVPYMEATSNLPNSPAYLVFSSGVTEGINETRMPATLEVDWVRCWRDTKLE